MTYTYQYTDTQQEIQSVDVTVTYSNCAPVSPAPDPQSTGFISLKRKSITIEIDNSLLVDLDIYFNFFQVQYIAGNTIPSSATTFFTLRKGNRLQNFTFNCEEVRTQQYAQGNHRTTKDYEFIEQPEGELPVEPEPIEPDRPEEEPYSDVPRWWFEFEKISEGFDPTICRVEIFTKQETTGSTELAYMQDTPISIKRRGDSEDIFKPIIGGYADLNFLAFEEDQFKPLFSSRDGEAKIRYYEDAVLFFEGFSVASEYKESYTDPPYQIRATFTDGIALLKHRTFEIAYSEYRQPVLQVIHDVLAKIPSSLDVYAHIHTKASEMGDTDFFSPVISTDVDVRTFQDENGKPLSCYEVLESLCRTFAARFHSSNAEDNRAIWVFDEINAIINYQNRYKVFASGSLTQKDDVGFFNRIFRNSNDNYVGIIINGSGTKKQKNLISEVEITEEKEFIFSLLPDRVNGFGEFNRMDVTTNPVQSWLASWDYNGDIKTTNKSYWEGGNVARALEILTGENHVYNTNSWTINDEDYIESESVSVRGGNAFNLEFRILFKPIPTTSHPANPPGIAVINDLKLREGYQPAYLPVQIVLSDPEDDEIKQYSDENGFWSDNVQYIRIAATQYDSFLSYKLENILLPENGELSFRLFAPVPIFVPGAGSDAELLEELVTSAHINYIKNQYLSENDFATTKRTITLKNNAIKSSIAEPYTLDLLLGDADTLENVSALSYNGNPTSGWTRDYISGDTARSISELAGLKILEQYNFAEALILEDFEILENGADIVGHHYSYHKPIGLTQYPNRRFLATDWEYVPKSSVGGQSRGAYIRGTWVEVRNDEVTDLEIIIDEDTSTSKNNAGGGSGGGTTTITNNVENDYNIRDILVSGTPENPVYVQLTEDNKLAVNLETISGWTGTTPTLQQVTDQGDITNRTITAAGFKVNNINFYLEGIARDVGDLLFRADNLRLQSDGSITRLTVNSTGDIVLNTLTGSTTEVVSITSDGRLGRMSIPNGSGGTVTLPTLQQVTDEGNATTNEIVASGFKSGLITITSGSIVQQALGGGGAPQSLSISSEASVIINSAISIASSGLTRFYNRTITPTKFAAFNISGDLGEAFPDQVITAGTGLAWDADRKTLYYTGSTTDNDNYVVGAGWNSSTGNLSLAQQNGNIVVNLDGRYSRDNFYVTGSTFNNGVLTLNRQNGSISQNLDGRYALIGSFTDTNHFTTGATFNTSNGVLTFSRQNGTYSVDLDNRYTLISNTFSGDYNDLFNRPFDNVSGDYLYTTKKLWLSDLQGSGNRMVIAGPSGTLSTQPIPSGNGSDFYVTGGTFNSSTRVLTLNRQNGSATITLTNVLTSVPTLQQVTSAGASTNSTITLSSLSGSGTRMVVANSSGTLSTQAIPSGGGGGGVSGTAGVLPVFDSSADGVGNSVISQGNSTYGVVINSDKMAFGNSSINNMYFRNGSGSNFGTLFIAQASDNDGNTARMQWSGKMILNRAIELINSPTPNQIPNGCVLFSQNGELKVRKSDGSIVTLA